MFSITSNEVPRPKLRVILRSSTPSLPQEAHSVLDALDAVCRDDEKSAVGAELDNGFGFFFRVAGDSANNELDLACFAVTLARNDFACKDDVFEVEDRKIVIVEFFGSVKGTV